MFQEGMRNIRLELIDIMDRIDAIAKDKNHYRPAENRRNSCS